MSEEAKELELARRELILARKELESSRGVRLGGANLVALVGSVLSVASVVAVAVITWTGNSDVQALRLQAQLINKALERSTKEQAADYLKFLVKIQLLKDPTGAIMQYSADPEKIPLAPPYLPSDVEWYRGLPKSAVFKTQTPQAACNPVSIRAVNGTQTAEECGQSLHQGVSAYEGVIHSKLVIWWPPVFGSWPACACTPNGGYQPSETRAFP